MICKKDEKTSCLQIKKMKKKNQIPEYYALNPVKTIKKIHEQSIDKKTPSPIKY